ncbi:hypothetical protein EYR38_002414 [Pleurotus pulmonarius]|nr:hypothetical protein EYR38_002414 [Pleurotus pulmonarius]
MMPAPCPKGWCVLHHPQDYSSAESPTSQRPTRSAIRVQEYGSLLDSYTRTRETSRYLIKRRTLIGVIHDYSSSRALVSSLFVPLYVLSTEGVRSSFNTKNTADNWRPRPPPTIRFRAPPRYGNRIGFKKSGDSTGYHPGLLVSCSTPAHEVPHVLLPAPPPSDVINAHALRALLQASASASANSAAQGTAYGQLPYVHQGAELFDTSLAPWLSPLPLLAQNHAQSGTGTLQGYDAGPLALYPPTGMPTSNQCRTPVPQPSYQYGGYYYNYFANGGAVGNPKSGVPGFRAFCVRPSFEQPSASLGSSKPLSASGRPNEPAALSQGGAADSVSSKRKGIPSHAKEKARGRANEVVENAYRATSAERTLVNEEDGAPSSKKPRRAPSASASSTTSSTRAAHPRTATTNLKYTQVGPDVRVLRVA